MSGIKGQSTGGSGGGATNSFVTIQPDTGTAPVADSATDTLTLTSSDGSIQVVGDSSTDAVSHRLSPARIEKRPTLDDEFFGLNAWSAPGGAVSAGFTGSYAADRPGQVRLQTTSNVQASIYKEGYHFLGGGVYEYRCGLWISNLSDATNDFTVRVGIGDSFSSTEHSNGVYFDYNHALNTGQWVGKTAKAGSRTSVNSAIAVVATTWYDLKFVVNAGATSVEFFVDGVSIGTSATNIPNTTSNLCAPSFQQNRTATAASAARYVVLDYVSIDQTLTTARN